MEKLLKPISFGQPYPHSPLLQRRERAKRYYLRQKRDRLCLHWAMLACGIMTCITCGFFAVLFYFSDLIRPYLEPDTPLGAIAVLIIPFSLVMAFFAGRKLRNIHESALRFGRYYTNNVDEDGMLRTMSDLGHNHDSNEECDDGEYDVQKRAYSMAEIYNFYHQIEVAR